MRKDSESIDWRGGKEAFFRNLGASNHSMEQRACRDYYATPPKATELLLQLEEFSHDIWEPAAGEKHISCVLEKHGHKVRNSDIIDRTGDIEVLDFFQAQSQWNGDIITNPPYKYAAQFVEHAMNIITQGHKVAMLMKLTFLEGKSRRALFNRYPPKVVYVSSSRLGCMKNGVTDKAYYDSAICYCWFVWQKGFKGDPTIKWFN